MQVHYTSTQSLIPFNNNIIIYCNIRIQLAALHFNENANQEQAVSPAGEPRYDLVFPKFKKGGYIVKKITKDPTYGNNGYGD